jgi:hypothetical protein
VIRHNECGTWTAQPSLNIGNSRFDLRFFLRIANQSHLQNALIHQGVSCHLLLLPFKY